MTTNRYEAIERALTAILVAGDVTRDTLEIAQKALALPKDAERVALIERIDARNGVGKSQVVFPDKLLVRIRAYLQGDT